MHAHAHSHGHDHDHDHDHDAIDRGPFEDEARRRVSLGLIVREIIQVNSLTPDADRVRARVESMASAYESPQAFVQWYYSDASRLATVESSVLEEQVVDLLLEQAEVVDKPMSAKEFM